MDGLLGLIITGMIFYFLNKGMKKAGEHRRGTQFGKLGEAFEKAATVFQDEFSSTPKAHTPTVKPLSKPISRPLSTSAPVMPPPVSTPQIFSTLTPNVQQGGSLGGMGSYTGSLGVSSTEGMDLCDSTLNHDRIIVEEPEAEFLNEYEGSALLPFPFTADAVMQGVIMSEVLTRPAQRKWGRR